MSLSTIPTFKEITQYPSLLAALFGRTLSSLAMFVCVFIFGIITIIFGLSSNLILSVIYLAILGELMPLVLLYAASLFNS